MTTIGKELADQAARQRVGKEHRVALIEGGLMDDDPMPGYYLIKCACGRLDTRSYWGHDHAAEIAERHLFSELHALTMTPGGASVR